MKKTIKEVYDLIKEKMDKAIKQKRLFKDTSLTYSKRSGEVDAYNDVLHIIESNQLLEEDKSKKALEIIKNKRVNVFWLMECISHYINALEKYNEEVLCKDIDCLTQEEYELLKEVLL